MYIIYWLNRNWNLRTTSMTTVQQEDEEQIGIRRNLVQYGFHKWWSTFPLNWIRLMNRIAGIKPKRTRIRYTKNHFTLHMWLVQSSRVGIIISYFFNNSVNAVRNTKMINKLLKPDLKWQCKFKFTILQQDEATCHTAKITIKLWWHMFGYYLIPRFVGLC